jgi:uncharacterized phosphosugar-binding protein
LEKWELTVKGREYLHIIRDLLERLEQTQMDHIQQAASLIADAIVNGHNLFAAGVFHSALAVQDVFYRGGGLTVLNILSMPGLMSLDTRPARLMVDLERVEGYGKVVIANSPLQAGDVLIVVSTAGRNAVPIELAMAAKERGLTVIGVTSMAYTNSVKSRHSSGKKLCDVVDLVLDNLTAPGDACLELDNVPRFCPTSGIGSIAVLQTLVAETVEALVARGHTPPINRPGNVDGGMEYNDRHMADLKEHLFYL